MPIHRCLFLFTDAAYAHEIVVYQIYLKVYHKRENENRSRSSSFILSTAVRGEERVVDWVWSRVESTLLSPYRHML